MRSFWLVHGHEMPGRGYFDKGEGAMAAGCSSQHLRLAGQVPRLVC